MKDFWKVIMENNSVAGNLLCRAENGRWPHEATDKQTSVREVDYMLVNARVKILENVFVGYQQNIFLQEGGVRIVAFEQRRISFKVEVENAEKLYWNNYASCVRLSF